MFAGRSRLRRASATVEMAIVTPLLLTLVFGIIEYGWIFTVRQAMTNAAREGARTAVLQGSSDTDITSRVQQFLAPYGLTTYTVTITHSNSTNPVEQVALSIPYADVTLLGSFFGHSQTNLSATCSMRKEGM